MSVSSEPSESSWAEGAIEEACQRAQEWYKTLPHFEQRVNPRQRRRLSTSGARLPGLIAVQDALRRLRIDAS